MSIVCALTAAKKRPLESVTVCGSHTSILLCKQKRGLPCTIHILTPPLPSPNKKTLSMARLYLVRLIGLDVFWYICLAIKDR